VAEPTAPLIKFESGGAASVLRYDIPEPTSYEGKNFIELSFEEDIFNEAATAMPFVTQARALMSRPTDRIGAEVERQLRFGGSKTAVRASLPMSDMFARGERATSAENPAGPTTAMRPANPIEPQTNRGFGVGELVDEILDGRVPVIGTNVSGDPTVTTVPLPDRPDPHLYLVESLRLTSYLGDYGAGRIVKTFTLLPGELTKISIKTYRQRESTKKSASSILDSLTSESATDLEQSVLREQSDQEKYQKTAEYYAEGEASSRWGWGSASIKAGYKGSTNAAREESVKNVSNATQKHAAKASAKREIEINTSYEVTEKEGEEISTERQIENINRSRTLNFVFRQMNQEFITLLHLTDIRVGFFNGDRITRAEVPISGLDGLLKRYVKPALHDQVRDQVLDQLKAVRDRNGQLIDVTKTVAAGAGDEYVQFNPDLTSSTTDGRGRRYVVSGVLLKADSLVMRTEGVMVEALLGSGPALDDYAAELQRLEVERRDAEVSKAKAAARQAELINEAISEANEAKASIAEKFVCCHERSNDGSPAAGGGNS
jgi:hypothetical protein